MIFDSSLNSWSEGCLAGFVGEAGALGDVDFGVVALGAIALGAIAFGAIAFGDEALGVVNLSIVDAFGSFESTIEALLDDKSLAALLIWPVSFIF